MTPAPPSPPTGRFAGWWNRSKVIAATVAGVVAFFAAAVTILAFFGVSGEAPPAAASRPPESASDPRPGAAASCRTDTEVTGDCGPAGSGLVIPNADCTPAAVLAAWGYDASIQMSITTRLTTDGCLVLPAGEAAASGANADDIARASRGQVGAVLLECARTRGTPSVPCNAPHEFEWISSWTDLPAGDDQSRWCHDLASVYTGNSLRAESAIRSFVFASGGTSVRCATGAADRTLTDTLRDIGNAALPYG